MLGSRAHATLPWHEQVRGGASTAAKTINCSHPGPEVPYRVWPPWDVALAPAPPTGHWEFPGGPKRASARPAGASALGAAWRHGLTRDRSPAGPRSVAGENGCWASVAAPREKTRLVRAVCNGRAPRCRTTLKKGGEKERLPLESSSPGSRHTSRVPLGGRRVGPSGLIRGWGRLLLKFGRGGKNSRHEKLGHPGDTLGPPCFIGLANRQGKGAFS